MGIKAVFPPGSQASAEQIKVSPGIISGNHLFLTGMTGSNADASMSPDPIVQIHNAFAKIESILNEANLSFDNVVEMTTYHLDIKDHFDLFNEIRSEYVVDPFPAWTAVEVAGLRREGAIVEIRVIASIETAA